MSRCLGIGAAAAAAPYAVLQPSTLHRLYDWQLPAWAAVLALSVFTVSDRPAAAPSASTAAQWAEHDAAELARRKGGAVPAGEAALRTIVEHAASLCGHGNFVCLAVSYSVLGGIGWAFLTVVGQLLGPCGYRCAFSSHPASTFCSSRAYSSHREQLRSLTNPSPSRSQVPAQRRPAGKPRASMRP